MQGSTANRCGRLSISVIVPTYREAENLNELVARIDSVRQKDNLALDLFIMDDDSQDGTEKIVTALGLPWVNLIVRTNNRGLSAAVLDGFKAATNEVFVVMDADLSHPPEKIPELVDALAGDTDFVIGSRYVENGSTAEEWGVFRWLNSSIATLLAWPFTSVKDPMSGFFAIRRETVEKAAPMSPVGYKIGLELIVKCPCTHIAEIPIHFAQRGHGQSKLSLKEQLQYLQHLFRLFRFKWGKQTHGLQGADISPQKYDP